MTYFAVHFKTDNRRFIKAGFSLIELLAVIAVVGILVAIILPVTNSVRNSARITKSLSNLRQLAAGMQMYSTDNQGFYPIGYHESPSDDELSKYINDRGLDPGFKPYGGASNYSNGLIWYQQIAPYIDEIIRPGNADSILVSPFTEDSVEQSSSIVYCSYSVHGAISPNVSFADGHWIPVWNIRENPSDIILIGEGTLTGNNIAQAIFQDPNEWLEVTGASLDAVITETSESSPGALSYRANNQALVAFLDGHVAALPKGTVRNRNIVVSP